MPALKFFVGVWMGMGNYGRFDMSAAAEHASFEQHALDFDNVQVIDCERHGMKRRIKEALYIDAEKHSIQRQRIRTEPNLVQPLSLTPFVVFQKHYLSLSFLLGTYSFFSSFPSHSPVHQLVSLSPSRSFARFIVTHAHSHPNKEL